MPGNLPLSPHPSHAKHALARRSMVKLHACIEAAQVPRHAVNEVFSRLPISLPP